MQILTIISEQQSLAQHKKVQLVSTNCLIQKNIV